MSKRTKIILIGVLALIILILIVLLATRSDDEKRSGTAEQAGDAIPVPEPLPPVAAPAILEPAPEGPVEQNVRAVAADFTERYGSFSTDGNYQNLRDLFGQMTVKMRAATESFITRDPLGNGEFMGVTTRAVRTEVVEQTDNTARITVATQRIETKTNAPERVFYETAELSLMKTGLRWLVDSFTWGK